MTTTVLAFSSGFQSWFWSEQRKKSVCPRGCWLFIASCFLWNKHISSRFVSYWSTLEWCQISLHQAANASAVPTFGQVSECLSSWPIRRRHSHGGKSVCRREPSEPPETPEPAAGRRGQSRQPYGWGLPVLLVWACRSWTEEFKTRFLDLWKESVSLCLFLFIIYIYDFLGDAC